jgi:hypothetical protein
VAPTLIGVQGLASAALITWLAFVTLLSVATTLILRLALISVLAGWLIREGRAGQANSERDSEHKRGDLLHSDAPFPMPVPSANGPVAAIESSPFVRSQCLQRWSSSTLWRYRDHTRGQFAAPSGWSIERSNSAATTKPPNPQ